MSQTTILRISYQDCAWTHLKACGIAGLVTEQLDSSGVAADIVRVRRRQARSIETRARIIEAATQEFADRGFDGASTRTIATSADVRHALIIYHFESKKTLWEVVMRDVLASFNDAFAARLAGLRGVDDVSKLKLLQADFIRLSAERPALHWLMSREAGVRSERIEWIVRELLGGTTEIFESLIRSVQAKGRYVDGDATHLHYVFLGAAARIYMLSAEVEIVTGRSPFDPLFVEEHVSLCLELFHRGGGDQD